MSRMSWVRAPPGAFLYMTRDSVVVVVRVSPVAKDHGQAVFVRDSGNIELAGYDHCFHFDSIFGPATTQQQIFYQVGRCLVSNCLEGFNSCVFCYGQTGSGKTHTMLGTQEDPGLIERTLKYLFFKILQEDKAYSAKCSFFQIYNEQFYDLLDTRQKRMALREDLRSGIFIEGIHQEQLTTPSQVFEVIEQGRTRRHVAFTEMNKESSRSHSVFTLHVQIKHRDSILVSKLHFVDLAGSERQKRTSVSGDRLKEANSINKSLSTLGLVIKELSQARKKAYISYRDSKLTFFLKDSLGGNSRSFMVATVSADALSFQQTLMTLKFAERVKSIPQNAYANFLAEGTSVQLSQELQRMRDKIKRLQAELQQRSHLPLLAQASNLLQEIKGGFTWLMEGGDNSQDVCRQIKLLLQQLQLLGDSSTNPFATLQLRKRLKDCEFQLGLAKSQIARLGEKLEEKAMASSRQSLMKSVGPKQLYSKISQNIFNLLGSGRLDLDSVDSQQARRFTESQVVELRKEDNPEEDEMMAQLERLQAENIRLWQECERLKSTNIRLSCRSAELEQENGIRLEQVKSTLRKEAQARLFEVRLENQTLRDGCQLLKSENEYLKGQLQTCQQALNYYKGRLGLLIRHQQHDCGHQKQISQLAEQLDRANKTLTQSRTRLAERQKELDNSRGQAREWKQRCAQQMRELIRVRREGQEASGLRGQLQAYIERCGVLQQQMQRLQRQSLDLQTVAQISAKISELERVNQELLDDVGASQ